MSRRLAWNQPVLTGETKWLGNMPAQYFTQITEYGAKFKHIIQVGSTGLWMTLFQDPAEGYGLFNCAATDHHGIMWLWPLDNPEPSGGEKSQYVVTGDLVDVNDWLLGLARLAEVGCTRSDVCDVSKRCERCLYTAEAVLLGNYYCAMCADDRDDEYDEHRPIGAYRYRTHMDKPFDWRADGPGRVFPALKEEEG